MKERAFTPQDQAFFAALSGDYNPMHLDPLVARRTMFGRIVVHGLHAALWGTEVWLEAHPEPLALRSFRASFQNAIGVGEMVRCSVEVLSDNRAEIELLVRESPAVWMTLEWESRRGRPPATLARCAPERRACRALSFDEVANASGSVDLGFAPEEVGRLFPRLLRSLDSAQLAQILATTRLVGMECPGLHSVFSGLDLDFSTETGGAEEMTYRVIRVDAGLSLASIEVRGPGMNGRLQTFIRPAPRTQPGILDLSRSILPGEFAGQRALIIGGSRGLGEVAAKLLSAGGACVTITYLRGADDARGVVEEIKGWGGSAACTFFDVLRPQDGLEAGGEEVWPPTHLYYFATPPISTGRRGSFSAELFQVFCDHYVTGFVGTVRAVRSRAPGLQAVFYPSSIYVEDPPVNLNEYAAAKAAGEVAAHFLARSSPGLTVHWPRLPRLATDQTASLLPVTNLDPAPVLLEQLRVLRERVGVPRPGSGR